MAIARHAHADNAILPWPVIPDHHPRTLLLPLDRVRKGGGAKPPTLEG